MGKQDLLLNLRDSWLERQIIRMMVFALAAMSIIFSVQLFITFWVTNYNTWIQQNVSDPALSYIIMSVPLVTGILLIFAESFKKYTLVKVSLTVMWFYNLVMAFFNGVAYAFQSTIFPLYLTVGVFATILYVYYNKRDDEVQSLETL